VGLQHDATARNDPRRDIRLQHDAIVRAGFDGLMLWPCGHLHAGRLYRNLCLRIGDACGQRVVVGENLKLHARRYARRQRAAVGLLGLRAFAVDVRDEEALGALQVANKLDGAIAVAGDAQVNDDVTFGVDLRLDGGDLNADGQHVFKIHHDGGPGEALLEKEHVEKVRAGEYRSIRGLAHALLVVQLFLLRSGCPRLEAIHLQLSAVELLLHHVRDDAERDDHDREHAHKDAQTREEWPKFYEGPCGEIDGDAH